MNPDYASLQKLLSLDEQSFKNLVAEIAAAAGADPFKAKAMVSNSESLRANMARMTEDEAKSFLDKVGKDKAEKIYDIIRRRS